MKQRYPYLDTFRGLTLLSMMFFHGTWDLVFLTGLDWQWYFGKGAYVWQQSICWSFILLSGFCFSFGLDKPAKTRIKRGLQVFLGGAVITAVTLLVMPEERVIFGVLTLIGSCMLILLPFQKLLRKAPNLWGFLISFGLFLLVRDVNDGYLGFESLRICRLPSVLYRGGYFMTYLGFVMRNFFSTDYFSVFPWIFLYLAGVFAGKEAKKRKLLSKCNESFLKLPNGVKKVCGIFGFMGKHSLLIYMIHQPILYAVLVLLPQIIGGK